MGWSLRGLWDDVFGGGNNNQPQRPQAQPARPGGNTLQMARPQPQPNLTVQNQPTQTPNIIQFGQNNPIVQPHISVGVAQPQHLFLGNQEIQADPNARVMPDPTPPPPSLGDHLRNMLTDVGHAGQATGRFVDNNVIKPVVNTAKVPVDLGTAWGQELAGAPIDEQLKSANALENAWNGSLPGMVTNTAKPLVKGIANTPQAIAGEIASQSSDPYLRAEGIKEVQDAQRNAFGTNDSGSIAKQIIGSTVGTGAIIAAPEVGKFASGAATPFLATTLSDQAAADASTAASNYLARTALGLGSEGDITAQLANPVRQKLLEAGVNAATQAPVGYTFGASGEMVNNPNASLSDINKAGLSGAGTFAALGAGTPLVTDAAKAGGAQVPRIIQYAKDNAGNLDENGFIKNPFAPKEYNGLTAKQIVTDPKNLQALQDYQESVYNQEPLSVQDQQRVINAMHDIKQNNGLDFVTGSPLDRANKIADYLDQHNAALPDYQKALMDGTAASPIKPLNEVGAVGKNVSPPDNSQPSPDEIQKLIDSSKQKIAAADKAMAQNDQITQQIENAGKNSDVVAPKPTGVVDKQLNDIRKVQKQIVDYATNERMQGEGAVNDIRQAVRQAGGISSSDHEGLPSTLKNKNGLPMDEMAANLGFKDDQALMDAIENAKKPMTKAEVRQQVLDEIQNGQHPYSADYQQALDMEKQRMDELSQYPKGTRAQVKVTDKPAPMSDAEFASLTNTPEGKAQPAGNKVIANNPKSELRNADAERAVIDSLNKGKTTSDIIDQYQKDTGVTLQKAVSDISRVANEAGIKTDIGKNPLLNPDNPKAPLKLPTVDEGNWKQATLNARFIQAKEQELGAQALDSYKALSPNDQVLLKKIEQGTVGAVSKSAENPEAFKQAARDLRTYFDTRHAYDTQLGIDVGYRTNYIRHFFDQAENPEIQPTGDEQLRGGGANKAPGYTKQRTVESLAKDVGDALQRDIQSSSFNHAKLAYENGLNEAFPGKVANGEIPRSTNAGKYVQIDHPFGGDLSVPKDIAHEINSRVWHENDSKALDTYDKLNHGLKYVKLSGGLFHAFTESGNFVGQQLASGKIVTDPLATARLAKVFFSDKGMQNEVAKMADNGTIDKARLAGLTIRSKDILADVNVDALDKSKGQRGIPVIQQMHDATFQREIPFAKLKLFEQKTEGLDPNKPADLAKMRSQADTINNLFGGINREVQGIKPGTFKWLQRGLLATDFTEGKYATLWKALSDKGAAGTTARQAVAGKALLFGLLATAGAAAGGQYQGKSGKQIATDAAGNLLDPSFEMGGYKVGLPKTHISEVVDAVKPTQNNGKAWNGSGLLTYAQDRTAALPSEVIQLLSNKNYYGQPLYGTNTKKNGGGKISAPQAALNIAQTGLPIPFGQVTNTVTGKQNAAAAAANVVGFKAKPNPDNTVAFQGVNTTMTDKQTEAYQGQLNSTLKTMQQQLTSSSAYKNASPNDQSKMMSDLKSNVTAAVNRDYASKNNLGQYSPSFNGKGTQATTKQQDILNGGINPDAYVPNAGNNDSLAVAKFKNNPNQKTMTQGNDTYYKTSDGQVKHTTTFEYQTTRQKADLNLKLEQAKNGDNFDSWKSAALNKMRLLQQMANHYDPVTQSDQIDAVQQEADTLLKDMQKYSSYGGSFTKPKSEASQIRSRTTSNISGIGTYKFFNPTENYKSLRALLDAARVA